MNQANVEKAKAAIKFGQSKRSIPLLILLMGLPGAGKSYVAAHLHQKYGFSILSGENITQALFGREKCAPEEYEEAYQVLHAHAEQMISQGYIIVIDATNGQFAHRQQIYDAVKDHSHKSLIIQLITDDETAFKRIIDRGIDKSDPQNIKSDISEETYESFRKSVESPKPEENACSIVSDEKVLESVDKVIDKALSDFN